ncbi:MAG: hypothetical protein JWP55_3399 [Mycobacterium sp.]|jgi:hypothetical protein|nr:hypothetical protein [Mycobacterium sp.]
MSLAGEEQSGQVSVVDVPLDDISPSGVSRRAAVTRVFVGLLAAGVVAGAVWAWLAPPIQAVVALTRSGDRIRGYLGDESDHLFLGAFLIAGLLGFIAVVSATLVWQWQAHRGPAMVGALAVGGMAAAGAATGVGAVLVRWRYGVIDLAAAPVTPEHRVHYVIEAPAVFFGHTPLQIATTILLPAGASALIYALCALATKRDDLGAWPAIESMPAVDPGQFVDPRPVSGPVPTAGVAPPRDPSPPSG